MTFREKISANRLLIPTRLPSWGVDGGQVLYLGGYLSAAVLPASALGASAWPLSGQVLGFLPWDDHDRDLVLLRLEYPLGAGG